MINITEKNACCGCAACFNVCPRDAIELKSDNEGFVYPIVDVKKCIDCNMCVKVCPMTSKKTTNERRSMKYAVQNRDIHDRIHSTAGGFFSVIADWVIEKYGVVYAVGFDEGCIIHKRATNRNDLLDMRGSKYVQSSLDGIFDSIRKDLNRGAKCLFVGTPCQVYGLSNYINQKHLRENLILVDLLCLGVSSPSLYSKWIKYLERKYQDKVDKVFFRDKSYGYATANVKVKFHGEKAIDQCYDAKALMKTFFQGYNMRPSCYDCRFRCVDRVSDFTIGDFHQIGQYCADMDDDKGTTCLWIHTDLGTAIFKELSEKLVVFQLENVCSSTLYSVSKMTEVPQNREDFFRDAERLDWEQFAHLWAKNDIKAALANVIKPMLKGTTIGKAIFMAIKKHKIKKFQNRIDKANYNR